MNDIFDKHIGISEPLIIGEDKFQLEQLGSEHIPKLLKLSSAFGNCKTEEDTVNVFQTASDDLYQCITDLINITLKESFPDMDQKKLDKFGLKYMVQLLSHIVNINSQQSEDTKKVNRISKIKDRLNNDRKSTKKETEKEKSD